MRVAILTPHLKVEAIGTESWRLISALDFTDRLVATLAAALSLSEKQLDGLFTLAASL